MGNKLYVGNLPYSVTEGEVNDHFSQVGEVVSVNLISDRNTGRAKGFGFVEMANDDLASQAISQLNGKEFSGRPLTVNEARPMEPRQGGRGGRSNHRRF